MKGIETLEKCGGHLFLDALGLFIFNCHPDFLYSSRLLVLVPLSDLKAWFKYTPFDNHVQIRVLLTPT